MKKIANTILATMVRLASESHDGYWGFWTREEIQECVLASGTGWTNKAITHLVTSGRIGSIGDLFVVTKKGAEAV